MVAADSKPWVRQEVSQPEFIEEAYCLSVQVVKHPFLDVPLVLPDQR